MSYKITKCQVQRNNTTFFNLLDMRCDSNSPPSPNSKVIKVLIWS